MEILDPHFKKNPWAYIVQSILALATFFVVLLFVEKVTQVVIVAALGASTFIVFSMPHTMTARPRRLIGGHTVGLISGTVSHLLFVDSLSVNINESTVLLALTFACAIALSMFLMAVTNTEHPPAAATSIGLLLAGLSWAPILFVLLFAGLLSIIHYVLRRYLINLF
ncbi:HPP family protein [Dehalogenimonas etheniformans]|uniref:HPP family protein n=1 Tax=Dehalogenimonas etheniformans TaxID=1536648 RepID=A0A2P5P768_9CHLR|nr:HPP family protein [Dehalogenimonas etheniformans]PPD58134.1 HPP family protein [Dehalogenimonas etheniformans]QNT75541.1 HPP family protein [Dehalogenimonas etheniformans]